jgi:hypothetical protein
LQTHATDVRCVGQRVRRGDAEFHHPPTMNRCRR